MNNNFTTSDLGLATILSMSFPIDLIDKTDPHRVVFSFVNDGSLYKLIEKYWKGAVLIEPRRHMDQVKYIKSRIYGEG